MEQPVVKMSYGCAVKGPQAHRSEGVYRWKWEEKV